MSEAVGHRHDGEEEDELGRCPAGAPASETAARGGEEGHDGRGTGGRGGGLGRKADAYSTDAPLFRVLAGPGGRLRARGPGGAPSPHSSPVGASRRRTLPGPSPRDAGAGRRFPAAGRFRAAILGGTAVWAAAAIPAGARGPGGGALPFASSRPPPSLQPPAPPGGEQPPVEALREGEAETQEEAEGESGAEEAEGGGEGGDAGEDAGESEEEADEEESGPRLAALATAPTGILPGVEQAAPNPDPGNPVVDLLLEEDGFVALTAGGRVVAFGPEGGRPLWGVMDGRAAAIGRIEGTVAVLDRDGGVTVRRLADGRPLSTPAGADSGAGRGDDALPTSILDRPTGWFGRGRLLHASEGRLFGRDLPGGAPVFEVLFEDSGGGEEEGDEERLPARVLGASFEEPGAERPRGASGGRFGRAAVSLGDGGLALLDTGNGEIRWRREEIGRITHPALLVPERDLLVVGSAEGELHALRLSDGRTRWRRRLYEGFRHPPLASRGRLYAVSEANSVYCFDLGRGGERWRAALPGRPAGAPLRLAGALVVAVRDGSVVELQPEIGSRIGRERRLDAEIAGVVRARGDGPGENGWRRRRLYLGLRDGRLAVLGPRTSLSSSR